MIQVGGYLHTAMLTKPPKKEIRSPRRTIYYLEEDASMPKTILVVDDDPDIIDMLKLYLDAEGYKTLEAFDGKRP